MESDNENDIKYLQDIKINVFFMNNKVNDFKLPSSLNELRKKVKQTFLIENKSNEEISIIYFFKSNNKKDKIKEKIIEVKADGDYITMLNRIKSDEIKEDTIYIETDKIPNETSRIYSINFEEEMHNLIECELRTAGEKIKKYLVANKNCFTEAKNEENKVCSGCGKDIEGNVYRSVININEKYFCEKCSFIHKDPKFIIH